MRKLMLMVAMVLVMSMFAGGTAQASTNPYGLPNVINADWISGSDYAFLIKIGYFSSPYDNCNCLYSPYVAWDE